MKVRFILSILTTVAAVAAQIYYEGKCNNVTVQQNFNIKKYMGNWYEIQKYQTIFQSGASCLKVHYTHSKSGSILVENSMVLYGANLNIYGTMREIRPDSKQGKFYLHLPEIQFNNEIWVLSTDYTNYSIIWSCLQYNNTNKQFAYVLSRTPNLTESVRTKINTILVKNNLDLEKFIQVNQTHCGKSHGQRHNIRNNSGLIFATIIMFSYKLCH